MTDFPAAYAVDQAICKLKPPVYASQSMISPAKYRPETSLDSMVFGSICDTLMPPEVLLSDP